MKTRHLFVVMLLAVVVMASGCTKNDPYPTSSPSYSSAPSGDISGVIESIEVLPGDKGGIAGSGIGIGTVIGGVVGGVLGHQVGGGTGKDVATAAGAVGGAVVGHEIDKRNQPPQQDAYQIRVRLNNGGYQTVTQPSLNDLRVGDRVRIENGNLYRY